MPGRDYSFGRCEDWIECSVSALVSEVAVVAANLQHRLLLRAIPQRQLQQQLLRLRRPKRVRRNRRLPRKRK